MTDKQRATLKTIFSMMSIANFAKKYYKLWSYTYLVWYINGQHARTKSMDEKLQSMLLDYTEDLQEKVMDITKKENVQ